MGHWVVYMVRCKNRSLYTGITNNLPERIRAHNAGTGAKYTRAFRPVTLVYSEDMDSPTAARLREAAIKHLTKAQKEALIQ